MVESESDCGAARLEGTERLACAVGDALERCALCVWVLWRVEPVLFGLQQRLRFMGHGYVHEKEII
jgi:hypothetical protein